MEEILDDVNVESFERFPTPKEIRESLPLNEDGRKNVLESRKIIKEILDAFLMKIIRGFSAYILFRLCPNFRKGY